MSQMAYETGRQQTHSPSQAKLNGLDFPRIVWAEGVARHLLFRSSSYIYSVLKIPVLKSAFIENGKIYLYDTDRSIELSILRTMLE